ncbi:3663755d-529a-42a5-8a93-e9a3ea7c7a05 [Sclerotinia trifoliorum]|uniref:3663755d-529a-42a5-8a93-e9a3ea7c7a05 n=1 Tax=Sclerotinia trifoliorum TaxID=28548 RepID=A0A8H2W2J7_9HELO|nr:3663755d-529a-42a5-8a93-e9a3ea7c7a05 [Sclerotinia trifoliorum]
MYDGFLDWALFCIDDLPSTDTDKTFNKFFPKFLITIGDFTQDDFSAAQLQDWREKYNALRMPLLIPYFKLASRTTDWKACILNTICATQKIPGREPSREQVFVGLNSAVSAPGDSGALICDINIAANNDDGATTLVPIAVVWRGEKQHGGWTDMTYGTPVNVVLKDIETFLGWDSGSIRFC